MRMLIVVGDKHSGGGSVVSGSPDTDIDGKAVARVGDKATCTKCKGVFPIVSGDPTLVIDGKPVARHGDKLACGCTLISGQQSRASIEGGGSGATTAGGAGTSTAVAAASSLTSAATSSALAHIEKSEVCEECLLAASKKGAAFLAR
ncbi:PAAR domain-containing protein (plasmid) [Xanthomonas citri pv. citri]|uniref:PAAR domain-containing protein n=1 Tax=Xanthomonas citri TaxID=346 RepID=UPI001933DF30|nr:PAAR domain-containing protein [Xanthomonas citri]QRD62776.1 PAAR domain-containing protein [Xanthomonas citri pv. citri]QRD67103.1 PAAR domain-containing protein [Xanthomonas citri pv. citri]QRD71644.1 PAAR domain-containing protein [Xanthomonas citri pv. citri]